MSRLFKTALRVLLLAMVVVAISSCEKDNKIFGEELISGELFQSNKAYYEVGVSTKKVKDIQSNSIGKYQLGNFNDPIFGTSSAEISAQMTLVSVNPMFGKYAQSAEGTTVDYQENEKTKEAILYIPFTFASTLDTDGDGLQDDLDSDPADPASDTDGDGLTDLQEYNAGTNPLVKDTDGDGILDNVDTDYIANSYAKTFALDSIYGTIEGTHHLTVKKLDYYLRKFNPESGYLDYETFYTSQSFNPDFTSDVIYDGTFEISDQEYIVYNVDDTTTTDVDESLTVNYRQNPGLRIFLDTDFFDTYIFDKEGASELLSQSNFREYLRGINLSIDQSDDLLMLLDMSGAQITLNYEYDSYTDSGTLEVLEETTTLYLGGNSAAGDAIVANSIAAQAYDPQISNLLDVEDPARIYLKAGAGSMAQIQLFDGETSAAMIQQIRDNKWIINEAKLIFYVDRTTLDNAGALYEPDRLYLYDATDRTNIVNTNLETYDDSTPWGYYTNFDGRISKQSSKGVKYTFRVTDYVNNIIQRDSVNDPLALVIASDVRYHEFINAKDSDDNTFKIFKYTATTPLSTVLFSNNVETANEDKKLILEIDYTTSN